MKKYKRYLVDEDADIPQSTKYKLRNRRVCLDVEPPLNEAQFLGEIPNNVEPMNIYNGIEIEPVEANVLVGLPIDANEDAVSIDSSLGSELDIADDQNIENHSEGEDHDIENYDNDDNDAFNGDDVFMPAQIVDGAVADDFLYPGALLTQPQSEALILSFAIRHHITELALRDLLHLINAHTPVTIHQSKYHFLKNLKQENADYHYYCENCNTNMSFLNGDIDQCGNELCHLFGLDQQVNQLKNKNCFFLTMSLTLQLASLLNNPEIYAKLSKDSGVSGVTSGKIYRDHIASGSIEPMDITLQWNTDGASASKSSSCSIWPIQVSINELPYRERKKHIILTGLWQGKKPLMKTFLRPFVNELRELHTTGITLNNGSHVKIHCLIAPVDSVARPLLQNMKQFNGKYGCSYCLLPGERIERLAGSSRVYCGDVSEPRTMEQHLRDATEVVETGLDDVNGVKGPSVLMLIPMFNIISSFTPDYMHNVLLGVVCWFMGEWLKSTNSEQPWYLGGAKFKIFSDRLTQIKPPSEITRPPRSLKEVARWKASEYKSFLLYYSVPCMKDILPIRYLRHWMLLVYAMTTFLKEKISQPDYERAVLALRNFVLQTEVLYGQQWMTYNMHTLLHLSESIQSWGAAWDYSAFMYENFNGILLNLFSGTRHISSQIFKNYNRVRIMNFVVNQTPYQHWHPEAVKLLKNLSGKFLTINAIQIDGLIILGASRCKQLTISQQIAIEELLSIELQSLNIKYFERFIITGIKLNVRSYARLTKRENSTVRLFNNNVVEISNLVDLGPNCHQRYVLLGDKLAFLNNDVCSDGQFKSSKFVKIVNLGTRDLLAFLPSDIMCKCVNMSINEERFVCDLVNSFERD